jgi:alpha/beta superfamily hydrolase
MHTGAALMNKEKAFFFERSDGSRLFGILHPALSANCDRPSDTAIIYCNPIFEEHVCSHRISVNFARHAANRGYSVLRFDYFGDGESDGFFKDASISTRLTDIETAIRYLENHLRPSRIFLLGLRFGATLALLTAEKSLPVSGAVAWAPIINLWDYLYTQLRSNLTAQMALRRKIIHDRDALVAQILDGNTVNIDGYEMGKPLLEEAELYDLAHGDIKFRHKCLFVQISPSASNDKTLANFITAKSVSSLDFLTETEARFWLPLDTVYPRCDGLFTKTLTWIQCSAK